MMTSAANGEEEIVVATCKRAVQRWVTVDGGGLPVAMFHYVARPPVFCRHRALFLAPAAFSMFLRTLQNEGIETIGLDSYGGCQSSVKRYASITFDDGSADLVVNALSCLTTFKFRSIAFLVAGKIGGLNDWDICRGDAPVRLADEYQVREWLSEGQWIGSHGMSHCSLLEVPIAKARKEIAESKLRLEDRFGVPVDHFCYPYGAVNEVIRDLVVEAGYRTACSTRVGINLPSEDPFLLRRTPVQHRRAWMASIGPGPFAAWC